jgi:hypothetical protein
MLAAQSPGRDDPLRLDRHGDDPHRDPSDHVDDRHDACEAWWSYPYDAAESEHDALLVLLDDTERERQTNERKHANTDEHSNNRSHDFPFVAMR